VTTPARTLLDLAAHSNRRTLERVIDQIEIRQLHLPIDELRARCTRRRGARVLRAVLDWHVAGSTITQSQAEEAFLAIVDAAGLPMPTPQAFIAGRKRDFAWLRERVVVEIDGREFHDTATAFERDRIRDNAVVLEGFLPSGSPAGGRVRAAEGGIRPPRVLGEGRIAQSAARVPRPMRFFEYEPARS